MCLLYCATDYEDALKQGPIVNFNLLQPNGKMLGYHQVEKLASVYDIHLRTGCFCNTGACVKYLGLDSKLLQQHLQVRWREDRGLKGRRGSGSKKEEEGRREGEGGGEEEGAGGRREEGGEGEEGTGGRR